MKLKFWKRCVTWKLKKCKRELKNWWRRKIRKKINSLDCFRLCTNDHMQEILLFSVWSHEKFPTHCPTISGLRKRWCCVRKLFMFLLSLLFQAASIDKCRAQFGAKKGRRGKWKTHLKISVLFTRKASRRRLNWLTGLRGEKATFLLHETEKTEHQHKLILYYHYEFSYRKTFHFSFMHQRKFSQHFHHRFRDNVATQKKFNFHNFPYQLIRINIDITVTAVFPLEHQHEYENAWAKQQLSTLQINKTYSRIISCACTKAFVTFRC